MEIARGLLVVVLAFVLAHAEALPTEGPEQHRPALTAEEAVMPDGVRLPLLRWLPEDKPGGVVLALHGFNDFSLSFESIGRVLADHGIALYAYDQYGFGATAQRGLWVGQERLVADAITMTRLLRDRYPEQPLYLLGESMGAAVAALALAADDPAPVDGAILMAPAMWARETQPWYQRLALWLGIRLIPDAHLTREWLDIEVTDDPEVQEYWENHPLVIRDTRVEALEGITRLMGAALAAVEQLRGPLLILYGGRDMIVPPEAVCAMLERLPAAEAIPWRFAFYPEGWHLLTRDSRAGETKRDIAAWLASPRARLPSGRELAGAEAEAAVCKQRGP